MTFVWEDPPDRSATRFAPKVDNLTLNPGRWARLEDGLSKSDAEGARRTLKSYWGCRVAVRKTTEDSWSLWAMVPEEDA